MTPLVLALAVQATMPAGPPPGGVMGPPPAGMGPPPRQSYPALADAVATPAFEQLLVRQGMSARGAAAVHDTAVHRDEATDRAALAEADRAVRAAAARTGDLSVLRAALARRDRLAAAQASARSEALLALLRPLDAGDRAVLLAVLGTGEGRDGPGGPPPGGPGFGPPPERSAQPG